MSPVKQVQSALSIFSDCIEEQQRCAITTQYVYPSNAFVTVYVESALAGSFLVSDGGGAVDCLSSHGLVVDSQRKLFPSSILVEGLRARDGVILSPPVPTEGLSNAVVTVARASMQVAENGLRAFRWKGRRDLNKEILQALSSVVGSERIHRESRITGASNRQYTFDFLVPLPGGRQLIIDAVSPDAASLNAKVVSHLDVGRTSTGNLEQRIVYDDEDDWRSSDLNLLQMAAITVPLSNLRTSLRGLSEQVRH